MSADHGSLVICGLVTANAAEACTSNADGCVWKTLSGGDASVKGTFSNLTIQATSGSVLILAADELVLKNSGNQYQVVRDVNISRGVSGAANAWYSVWVVYNPSTKTTASVLSWLGSEPALPDGYTYAARFGVVRTNAGGLLMPTVQRGREAYYINGPLPLMASGAAGNVYTPGWVAVDVTSFAPAAVAASIKLQINGTSGSSANVAPNSTYGGYAAVSTNPPWAWINSANPTSQNVDMILESNNIYWTGDINAKLFCLGWTDNL
ncbi:MAG: hypothetical protein PHY92_03255 [Alphaproteobacteria bacterium]|nr:hypothetical protein [Alphaproteobacteria bacterium]